MMPAGKAAARGDAAANVPPPFAPGTSASTSGRSVTLPASGASRPRPSTGSKRWGAVAASTCRTHAAHQQSSTAPTPRAVHVANVPHVRWAQWVDDHTQCNFDLHNGRVNISFFKGEPPPLRKDSPAPPALLAGTPPRILTSTRPRTRLPGAHAANARAPPCTTSTSQAGAPTCATTRSTAGCKRAAAPSPASSSRATTSASSAQ